MSGASEATPNPPYRRLINFSSLSLRYPAFCFSWIQSNCAGLLPCFLYSSASLNIWSSRSLRPAIIVSRSLSPKYTLNILPDTFCYVEQSGNIIYIFNDAFRNQPFFFQEFCCFKKNVIFCNHLLHYLLIKYNHHKWKQCKA